MMNRNEGENIPGQTPKSLRVSRSRRNHKTLSDRVAEMIAMGLMAVGTIWAVEPVIEGSIQASNGIITGNKLEEDAGNAKAAEREAQIAVVIVAAVGLKAILDRRNPKV